jgi:hypothetical protein
MINRSINRGNCVFFTISTMIKRIPATILVVIVSLRVNNVSRHETKENKRQGSTMTLVLFKQISFVLLYLQPFYFLKIIQAVSQDKAVG